MTAIGPLAGGNPARYAALAATLALLAGVMAAAAGTLRLGFLADLLSRPVLVGYMTGVALIMIAGQLGPATGVAVLGEAFAAQIASFTRHAGDTRLATVAITAAVLLFLFLFLFFFFFFFFFLCVCVFVVPAAGPVAPRPRAAARHAAGRRRRRRTGAAAARRPGSWNGPGRPAPPLSRACSRPGWASWRCLPSACSSWPSAMTRSPPARLPGAASRSAAIGNCSPSAPGTPLSASCMAFRSPAAPPAPRSARRRAAALSSPSGSRYRRLAARREARTPRERPVAASDALTPELLLRPGATKDWARPRPCKSVPACSGGSAVSIFGTDPAVLHCGVLSLPNRRMKDAR